MTDLISANLAGITEVCRRYGVKRLEVFGSAATGGFDPETSDCDFLVEFYPLPPGQRADAYFGLLEELQALLGRPVDLVVARAIRNPYFREAVEMTREVVYAA